MTLDKLLFDAEGGVTVELTPELMVQKGNPSFLALVPVTVIYDGKNSDGNLRYDMGKGIFITALTDFFSKAKYNHEHVIDMAKLYSLLLNQGYISIREMVRENNDEEWKTHCVYDNLRAYSIRLAERELVRLKDSGT